MNSKVKVQITDILDDQCDTLKLSVFVNCSAGSSIHCDESPINIPEHCYNVYLRGVIEKGVML